MRSVTYAPLRTMAEKMGVEYREIDGLSQHIIFPPPPRALEHSYPRKMRKISV